MVEQLPAWLQTGVYWGVACVDSGPVHGMVMSIGWNPHFQNTKKSMVMKDGEVELCTLTLHCRAV